MTESEFRVMVKFKLAEILDNLQRDRKVTERQGESLAEVREHLFDGITTRTEDTERIVKLIQNRLDQDERARAAMAAQLAIDKAKQAEDRRKERIITMRTIIIAVIAASGGNITAVALL